METAPRAIRSNVIIMELTDSVISVGENGGTFEGTITAGGILIPAAKPEERARKSSVGKGVVLSIGEQVEEVEEGDEVLYNIHAAKEMEVEGQMYLVLNVHEILAIITHDDPTGSEGTGS